MLNHDNGLFYYDKIKLRNLNIFWLGFIAYTFGAVFQDSNLINHRFFTLIQLFGLACLLFGSIYSIKFRIEDPYLKTVFVLYFCWIISLFLRDFDSLLNKQFLEYFLFVPEYGAVLARSVNGPPFTLTCH